MRLPHCPPPRLSPGLGGCQRASARFAGHELPFSLRRRIRSEGGVRVSEWAGRECGRTAPPVMPDAGACYVIRGSGAWVDTPRRYVMDVVLVSTSTVGRMDVRALIERVDQVRVLAAAELDTSFSTEAARAAALTSPELRQGIIRRGQTNGSLSSSSRNPGASPCYDCRSSLLSLEERPSFLFDPVRSKEGE